MREQGRGAHHDALGRSDHEPRDRSGVEDAFAITVSLPRSESQAQENRPRPTCGQNAQLSSV